MRQLTLSLIIVVIASVMGTGWVISEVYSHLNYNANAAEDEFKAYKILGKHIALSLDKSLHQDEFIQHWKEQKDLAISFQEKSNFPIPSNIKEKFEKGEPLLLESKGELSLHIYMRESSQIMTILLPVKQHNKRQSSLNLAFTLLFYLTMSIVLLAWLYPLIRRLSLLKKAAYEFGKGDLSSRITLSNTSYIADIENEFNRMASRIKTLIEDNKLLSSAVSHDLKTPLTRLRFGIDVLEETTENDARERYIKRINKDLDEMQSLIETLLQYANLDDANIKLKNEEIELNTFVSELLQDNDSDNKDITVTTDFSNESAKVNADPRYLAMQFKNIMGNALRHANSTVKVSISLHSEEDENKKIALTIEDDGDGIAKNERENVVKPFWRGKQSTNTKGHGMGLAIVERIAHWFEAELYISDSKKLGGALISLRFNQK